MPGADATTVVTVRPFEDGTAEAATVIPAVNAECGGWSLSVRADTAGCTWEATDGADPAVRGTVQSNLCFINPSDSSQAVCPRPDGTWSLLRDVQPADESAAGTALPEAGNIFRLELVGGGYCYTSSGSGPRMPDGYDAWAGFCELPGSANGTTDSGWSPAETLWVPEPRFNESSPFLAGVSEDGHLLVPIGPEGMQPRLAEVARVYR